MAHINPSRQTSEPRSLDQHSNIPCIWQVPHQPGFPLSAASSSSSSSQHPSTSSGGSSPSPTWSLPSTAPTLSDSPSPTSPDMTYNNPYYSSKNFDEPRTPSPTMSTSPPGSPYSYGSPSIASESMSSAVSPAPSVYSLTDSLRQASFKQVHGRSINNHSEVYMLPADEEEITRLETQHNTFRLLNNGHYLGPVREVLAGPGKQILDIGTGTGAWAVDMALEFPEAQVVGVDLSPIQGVRPVPDNCRFEVDDVNMGMVHFYDTFDVIHARHICAGITDYPKLVWEIASMLRPGGLALFFEAEYYIFDANKRPLGIRPQDPTRVLPERSGVPHLARFAAAFVGAVARRGGKINVGARMPDFAKQTGRFSRIVYQDVWFPVAPWMKGNSPEARRLRRVGHLIREDIRSFLHAGRPMLLLDGMSEVAIDELIRQSQMELDAAEIPMWLRGCYTWAQKAVA